MTKAFKKYLIIISMMVFSQNVYSIDLDKGSEIFKKFINENIVGTTFEKHDYLAVVDYSSEDKDHPDGTKRYQGAKTNLN